MNWNCSLFTRVRCSKSKRCWRSVHIAPTILLRIMWTVLLASVTSSVGGTKFSPFVTSKCGIAFCAFPVGTSWESHLRPCFRCMATVQGFVGDQCLVEMGWGNQSTFPWHSQQSLPMMVMIFSNCSDLFTDLLNSIKSWTNLWLILGLLLVDLIDNSVKCVSFQFLNKVCFPPIN